MFKSQIKLVIIVLTKIKLTESRHWRLLETHLFVGELRCFPAHIRGFHGNLLQLGGDVAHQYDVIVVVLGREELTGGVVARQLFVVAAVCEEAGRGDLLQLGLVTELVLEIKVNFMFLYIYK